MPNNTKLEKRFNRALNTHMGDRYLSDYLYISEHQLDNPLELQRKVAFTIEKMLKLKSSEASHHGLQLEVEDVPSLALKKKANDYMDGVQYAYNIIPDHPVKTEQGVTKLHKMQIWVWYTCRPAIDI